MAKTKKSKLKGTHLSEEHKKKISEGLTGRPSPVKGRPLSEKHKKKISRGLKGHPSWNKGKQLSEEHKKKISLAIMGHIPWNRGKKTPKRTRFKISAALTGHTITEETRQRLIAAKSFISDDTRDKLSKKCYFRKVGFKRGSTKTERKFARMHPELQREVVFGTGKGGRKKYGSSFFVADFLDKNKKIVYELNGSIHDLPDRIDRDDRKMSFFLDRGYKVIVIRNEDV